MILTGEAGKKDKKYPGEKMNPKDFVKKGAPETDAHKETERQNSPSIDKLCSDSMITQEEIDALLNASESATGYPHEPYIPNNKEKNYGGNEK
jgi:hypothetical protein